MAIVALMFSCSEKIQNPDSEKMPINISVGLMTRANDQAFESADEVGLYVVNYEDSKAGVLKLKDNQADNIKFTYDGNKWNSNEDIFWKDQNTAADFYAYYPYTPSISSIAEFPFSVWSDQSKEDNFWASDFLWGKSAKVSPTLLAVPIKTNHSLSRIVIDIKPGSGFSESSWKNATKSVCVSDVKTSAIIDLSTGVATATGNDGEIIPLMVSEQGVTTRYKAMMIPQTVSDNSKLITVTVDGVDYVYRKGFIFKSNTEHSFSITVNKIEGGVDMSIGEWLIDEIINQGEAIVEKENGLSNNQIWYKATEKIIPITTYGFGANIVSNEWDETTCEGLISFDGEVTQMGHDVFAEKANLIAISIPSGVKKIYPSAFYNCTKLSEVHISAIEAWCNIYFETSIIANWPYTNPLYYAKNLYLNGELVSNLIIPDGVKNIPNNAFQGCTSVRSVTVGKDIEYVGGHAFAECSNLKQIIISDTDHTVRLASNVFYSCSNLESVNLGNNITKIPLFTFGGCSGLESITIPETVTEINQHAFYGCTKLLSIFCRPSTPPAIYYKYEDNSSFPFNSGMKIYVPRASYDSYMMYSQASSGFLEQNNWCKYESYIQPYDFQ